MVQLAALDARLARYTPRAARRSPWGCCPTSRPPMMN